MVVLPLSTATFYTRPDIVHVKITNLAPNEVCLAWDAARPRHLVEEFATIATTHRATATTTS